MKDFFLLVASFDKHLTTFIADYGVFIYIFLFFIVYAKTAFVVLTFMPGDSLVFASGTLAAIGDLNVLILFPLYLMATILGDSQNFAIGRQIGKWRTNKPKLKLLSESQIMKAEQFVNRHGHEAIMFSRFIPLMRTTIPFIGGYTKYNYLDFIRYNFIGGIIWVFFWLNTGYVLGNFEWVKNNLVLALTIFSLIPIVVPAIFLTIRKYFMKERQT